MKPRWIGFSLLFLAACGGGGRAVMEAPAGPPPIRAPSMFALLGERERLQLTSQQIEALDSIGRWLARETQDLREDFDPQARPDSAVLAARSESMTALHVRAIQGVRELLTEEQRERVCDLQEERASEAREGRERQARPTVLRRGATGSFSGVGRWTWCPEPEEDERA